MDERTLNTGETPEAGETAASVWPVLTALVIDVAGAAESHESQDTVTDFIWHMLDREYQIYLCSSSTKDGDQDPFDSEEFVHTRLIWLHGPMPPQAAQLAENPALRAPTTLWISDDPGIRRWVTAGGAPFVSLGEKTASFSQNLGVGSWGELGSLLDPTTRTVRQVADIIAELRRTRPPGPIIVGLGGPPASGYERFAVELKRVMEASEFPLIEIMDVTPLFPDGAISPGAALPFARDSAPQWVVDTILIPLAKGQSVYVEKPPSILPQELNSVFPLFVSEESVLLVLGEIALHRGFRDHMHLAMLLDVSPIETARRMFEIPEGQDFDAAFTEQYLKGDGKAYADYELANQVVARSDLKIDANSPRRFVLVPSVVIAN